MLRDERGVVLVTRIAVAGQQHAHHRPGRRELREPRDHRRIETAAQADYESARAGCGQTIAHPTGEMLGTGHERRFYRLMAHLDRGQADEPSKLLIRRRLHSIPARV
jgi:hypothetical protein